MQMPRSTETDVQHDSEIINSVANEDFEPSDESSNQDPKSDEDEEPVSDDDMLGKLTHNPAVLAQTFEAEVRHSFGCAAYY